MNLAQLIDEDATNFENRYDNVTVFPTIYTSVSSARRRFMAQHQRDLVSFKHYTDDAGGKIPANKVLVGARYPGEDAEFWFLVSRSRYEANKTCFGYVIQSGDEEVEVEW